MRKDVYEYIVVKPKLHQFLREHPSWYRRLARRPMDIKEMEKEARQYYKQTMSHKVQNVVQTIEMAKMMMAMMKLMNDTHN
ncbi:YlbE-like family protein [Anoxybacillus sp. ST4]|uniref:YlbE-like family protein n=1 Tax=Anoxybacillus sp. ST4 TaxID=2864181 RepID=UPI001C63E0C4|nr:YlbE-like family protein [Anoxybacillus sp. ST4]MBW7650161.1 YlbE-like family protein [Anoxybacillus sp. ST4]